MTTAYTYTGAKARVRRVRMSPLSVLGGGYYWQASRPGEVYLVGDGWHFYTWHDAMDYAIGARS